MRCQKLPLWCRLTYGEDLKKTKNSGHMYDTNCIFSAHILCMVHTPFKQNRVNLTLEYYYTPTQFAGKLH